MEKETIKLFHIKKTNFKKIKNIKDKIYNSHILSIFSSEFRSAKKDYLNLLKEKKPYSRENAVKDLNEYLKYIKN